jgi:hypothetical protein
MSGCKPKIFCGVCGMKLNEMNRLTRTDDRKDELLKLANRIKTLRLRAGYLNYERFALGNGIARVQYRNYELGANITYSSLLRVMAALEVTPSEFFREGFDSEK